MDRQDGEKRGPNPFALGLLGLALMLAGYAALNARTETEDDARRARQRAMADRLDGSDRQTADALREEAGPPRTPALFWLGRLLFWGGVAVVVSAGVVWYRQAQKPEPPQA